MSSLKVFKPRIYQKHAIEHCLENPFAGLFLDMGLGKTPVSLTVIKKLMYEDFEINRVLVVAPKLVSLTVWGKEIEKWEHTSNISYSIITGSEKERIKAIKTQADVYIINREMLDWLVTYLQSGWKFDMVVLDELSSFKNHDSKRFRAFKIIRPRVKRVLGLTGTPASNGLLDLWAQLFCLDRGERLGKTITGYREAYFTFNPWKHKYSCSDIAEQQIHSKIGDICISMNSDDYLDLPDIVFIDVPIVFSSAVMRKYREFEKEKIVELINEAGDEQEVTAMNALTLAGKLAQFANGAIYDEDKNIIPVHNFKIDKLEEMLEDLENEKENAIVAYNYKHDLSRIMKRLPSAVQLKGEKEKKLWEAGKVKIMLAHPASAGHGLNDLQHQGSVIIWFSLHRSRELYAQINKRLHRDGQQKRVRVYRFIAEGTIDEDILRSLEDKTATENRLLSAVKAKIKMYSDKVKFKF